MRATRGQSATTSTIIATPVTMSAASIPSHETVAATAAPMPIAASHSIWITPKTRASTSSGNARWTIVRPATSATELPRPISANRTSATAGSGHTPMTISGMPHMRFPTMNGGVRRVTPVSESAPTAPTSAPTPIAELRKPTPPSPRSSSSSAITTMKTCTSPATAVCAVRTSIITRSEESFQIARNPASDSETSVDASISRAAAPCARPRAGAGSPSSPRRAAAP